RPTFPLERDRLRLGTIVHDQPPHRPPVILPEHQAPADGPRLGACACRAQQGQQLAYSSNCRATVRTLWHRATCAVRSRPMADSIASLIRPGVGTTPPRPL